MEKELRLRVHSGSGKWSTISGEDNLGFELEHNATSIVIELPSEVHGGRHFVEFIKPSGVVVSSAPLEETTDESGIHSISIGATSGLLNESGRYYLQYVGVKGEQDPKTFKSELKALDVECSVNAGIHIEESDEDFIRWATKQIADLKSRLDDNDSKDSEQDLKDQEHDQALGGNTETDNNQGLAIEGLQRDLGQAQQDLQAAQRQLNALEQLLASSVYSGIIFHGSSTVGVRVGASSGLTIAEIRNLPVFRTIRTFVGTDGHHKWSVNKFYVKHVSAADEELVPGDSGWYEGWYVAESKIDDSWELLPAFGALHKEKIIIGKYKAGVEGVDEEHGVLVSKPNLNPVNHYSPETAREHMPEGAHGIHFFEKQAIDILMWVSTGCRDLQREFYMGDCFDPYLYPTDFDWLNSDSSNVVYFPVSDLLGYTAFTGCEDADDILAILAPGTVMTLWDDDESEIIDTAVITAATTEEKYNESDDENVNCIKLTFNKTIPMSDYYLAILGTTFITGATDSVEGETGEEHTSMVGCRHFKWYGLEDWYGCVYEWLEGVALVGIYNETANNTTTHVKYCVDPAYYGEANYNNGNAGAMSHWSSALSFTSKNGGYVEEYKEVPNLKGFYIPYSEESVADDATFYADRAGVNALGANSSNPVLSYLFFGGSSYCDEFDAGPSLVYWSCSTYDDRYIGFRLSYDEE